MDLRKPAPVLRPRTVSVLKVAPKDQDAVVGTAAPRHLLDSMFARMLGGLLAVALPFFIIIADRIRAVAVAAQVVASSAATQTALAAKLAARSSTQEGNG